MGTCDFKERNAGEQIHFMKSMCASVKELK